MPRLACFAGASGVAQLFFIQYCDLLFRCGCEALWAGRAEHCNIHDALPPHCPWCLDGGELGAWTFGAVVAAQGVLAFLPGVFGWLRAALVLLAFPVVGGIAGAVSGLITGYWI